MVRRLLTGLLLLTAAAAADAQRTHERWTRAALDRVPVGKHDQRSPERLEQRARNLNVFAAEIARVSERAPLPARQWAALLITQASIESNLDTEVTAGRCLPHQCDAHRVKGELAWRAVGAFQQWNVPHVRDLWPVAAGNIPAQVEMADRTLRRSLTRCKPFAPFPEHVWRAYKGSSCSFPVQRESERTALYVRLMGTVTR